MSARGSRTRPGLVVLLAALTALGPLTINLYLPAFPQIAAELGAGPGQVQLTLTATLAGLALGQLLAGSVSDAVGRRPPLQVAYLLYILVTLVVAATSQVAVLTALRAVQGVTAAAGMVIAMAVVRDTSTGLDVGRVLSRLMLVVGVAPILAPALGSQLLVVGSWRLLFVVLAGLAVVLLALVTLVMPESLPPAARRPAGARAALRSYRALLADRTFLGLVAVAGLAIAGNFTYISASTFVFQEVYRVTPQQYGLLFGLGAVTVTAGTQVTGALLGRVRPGRIVGGALVVAILGSATLLAVPAVVGTGPGRLWPLLAVLLPTIGAVGMTFPAVPTIALGRLSHDAGSASAMIGAAQFGTGALAAPLTGLLGTSVTTMAALMLALFTTAGVVMVLLARREPGL